MSELAPVYSHFMTEDDTELKFNDADNDSASDSEQFSPSVKPLTIFPSPSFKPAMGNERLASPCVLPEPPSIPPLADHELPDSVEQVEQVKMDIICANRLFSFHHESRCVLLSPSRAVPCREKFLETTKTER